ncbi:MAG: YceD family protein [Gemmatimonadota bacterium]
MLTLDLVRLERETGPIEVHGEVPKDADLFDGADLPLSSPLSVDLNVSPLQSGELVVRGRVGGVLARDCRRCLEPVDVPFEEEVYILFVPEDEVEGEKDDGKGVHEYDLGSGKLELGEAIREETILAAPLYVECKPECRGLCPRCGANLNERECDCDPMERDPRWDALRELKTE